MPSPRTSSLQTGDDARELRADLLEAEQPRARRRLPAAPLPVRLKTSPVLRRLVPSRLALAVAAVSAERDWDTSPEARERGLLAMRAIVGGTRREKEAPELARQMAIETGVRESMLWQPWPTPLLGEESDANLRRAAGSGRGVLVSNCHLGPFNMVISVYRRVDRAPHILAAPWMFEPLAPGAWGRRTARWLESGRAAGARWVRTTAGAFATATALLESKALVLIAFDVPGSRTTRFLGKPVDLASGTARLAVATNSLVLPVRVRREGTRTHLDYAPALDPGEFFDADELHDVLAARHEEWILEEPEALEDPRRPGAWEGQADAGAWVRPIRPRSAEER
jgi:lauroyl/myristoyl acyltransferase